MYSYSLLVVAVGQVDEYERRRVRDERRVRVREREERRERRAVRGERVLHVRVERQVREALDCPAPGGRAFARVREQPLTRLGQRLQRALFEQPEARVRTARRADFAQDLLVLDSAPLWL